MSRTLDHTAPADIAHRPFLDRALAAVLTVGGVIGALASFTLIVEKIQLLTNPLYTPSCSINPILSCGSVMTTPQAAVFGFPNPLIGLAAFPVVTTVGVVLLAGASPPRWFWLGLQGGALFGVGFIHWLLFQSVYRIGALCPYCMIVWAVTIPIFWYTTLYNLDRGHIPLPARWRSATDALARYHTAALAVWLLFLAALIGQRFWPYWSSLLT